MLKTLTVTPWEVNAAAQAVPKRCIGIGRWVLFEARVYLFVCFGSVFVLLCLVLHILFVLFYILFRFCFGCLFVLICFNVFVLVCYLGGVSLLFVVPV